jgi:hypothetical protein
MTFQSLKIYLRFFVLTGLIFFLTSCPQPNHVRNIPEMPRTILWAWERPEDLRFINVKEVGVAFLGQTLVLENNEVNFRPRRQKLEIPPETFLIAVTRIETSKEDDQRPNLSEKQKLNSINLIKNSIKLPNVKALQIDFDVVVSERNFYRSLIRDLKKELPENYPLSITSLASWCVGDIWFKGLEIDEAVPMAFRMGTDDKKIRRFLAAGNDWNEDLCRGSYGISLAEPLQIDFKPGRRFFYFNEKPWRRSDLPKIKR